MFLSHFSTLRNIGHVKKNLLVSSDYFFVHISLNLSLIFLLLAGAYNTYKRPFFLFFVKTVVFTFCTGAQISFEIGEIGRILERSQN
jgi:uncharacterized membrane protein YwaF